MATRRTDTGTTRKAPAKPASKSLTTKGPKRTTLPTGVTPMEPIVLEGTFDDAAFHALWTMEPQQQLAISASRKFLWWEVHRQRVRLKVKAEAHTVTQAPDGAITYSVPMKVDGPCETILSPWWERTLYAIAGIWS